MLKTVGFPSTRTGDQTIVNGNIVIGTAGKGIDFSADPSAAGMTSELLDDYEEGTWTPALTSSSSGSVTITSPSNSMMYTKVGRVVTISGLINISSVSSPVGDLRLEGLPYNIGKSGAGSISVYNMLTNTTLTAYTFLIDDSVTDRAFIRGLNNGAQVASVANNLQTGSGMYLTMQYVAA